MSEVPRVVVRATRLSQTAAGYRQWSLLVVDCPYCHDFHFHGGGIGPRPDLGLRVADCDQGSYKLCLKGVA